MSSYFAFAHSPFEEDLTVDEAATCVLDGKRLSRIQAEALYSKASLHTLARLAHIVRMRMHPEKIVTYVGDRNINYSNICACACRFCAFYKAPISQNKKQSASTSLSKDNTSGYVITRAELAEKIDETIKLQGTQILMQGGHNPDLPFSWYEELLQYINDTWPTIHIHAFSPPEIHYWSEIFKISTKDILIRLKKAGLNSLPGGGAEILHDEVRAKVSPNKCTSKEWLKVMEEAHDIGLKSSATMMFGHEEKPSHRLDHLFAIRELQDKTNGFTAFIPWTFQPANTKIFVEPEPAPQYLRLLAISRLILDNFQNIQASWVTMGPQIAQLALYYGANDFGSLMIEENVVAAAGTSYRLSRKDIHQIIRFAGFEPVQRTQDYKALVPQPTE